MNENIKIIKNKINNKELRLFLNKPFVDMIKFVVDIEKEIIAVGGEMHADAESILLNNNSKQKNLWGGNIYPGAKIDHKIEYSSLINIRPSQDNRSIQVEDDKLKLKIKNIVNKLVEL